MPENTGQGFDWRVFLQAVASAAPHIAQYRANQQQHRDLMQGRGRQALIQDRADAEIGDLIGEVQRSSPEQIEAQSLADYTMALRRMRQSGTDASMPSNLGGEATQAAMQESRAGAQQYGRQSAGQLARIDAPAEQRRREGQRAQRTGTELEHARRQSDAAQVIAELRARSRQANPWVALLSRVGQQIGANYQTKAEDMPAPPPTETTLSGGFNVPNTFFTPTRQALWNRRRS